MHRDLVQSCDVAIIGSGSAALAAALVTSAAGLSTVILEKTAKLGGTTAMSGAGTWVPANHHAVAAGIDDTPAKALAYIRAASPPGWQETEDALWQAFTDFAPEMLAFVEARTPLRFALTPEPDPMPDLPGAQLHGRMLSPEPLSRRLIGRLRHDLRPPMLPHIFTYQEAQRLDVFHRPIASALSIWPRLLWRWLTSQRANGTALVTGLLKGCIDQGCRIETGAAVTELVMDEAGEAVRGCIVEQNGRRIALEARHGVVIATGGFEWDAERRARHFSGPVDFVTSPPGNTGDGHRMAEAVGAALAHMDQANLSAAAPHRYEGGLQGLSLYFFREPNAIVVDRMGDRFANEQDFNFGERLDARSAETGEALHLPAWVISDARLMARSPLLRRAARLQPGWLRQAETIEELAVQIGLPSDRLAETVARFNRFCAEGRDADFGREASGRAIGLKPAKTVMLPIDRPRFVAIPCNRSFVSTKGGPRTDASGAVLRRDGRRIGGLYCAGVAMANPIGTRAVGAGTTIGPNLTWGYISGRAIVAESRVAHHASNDPGETT
ncbi:FAD-dependent oxidoreductase [Kaistia dalseonensis]|uniref:3-oxosteroid 1-dehydrogenase n=1 Tax=Kaistia dalseonensis TaxID=410840 RepID=A0ABU0H8Q5_9HYPH|nr:FAD-dependent oxidoreductase [Kaistia dalseonensis]MCX5495553.1 FAD-dependent oxidoreductase [Kaistia dalseonensis]MDQ0438145.1 3-oxosteroid 1-dehydrogenase [Kaistia dalseonensis]